MAEQFKPKIGERVLVKPKAREGKPVPFIPYPAKQAKPPVRYLRQDGWTRAIWDHYLKYVFDAGNLEVEPASKFDKLIGEPLRAEAKAFAAESGQGSGTASEAQRGRTSEAGTANRVQGSGGKEAAQASPPKPDAKGGPK